MKNRRSTTEYLDAPQISEEIKGIQEQMTQEAKERKKAEKKDQVNGEMDVGASEEEDDAAMMEEEPIKTTLTHMVIGETDKPELPCKKDAGTDQASISQ